MTPTPADFHAPLRDGQSPADLARMAFVLGLRERGVGGIGVLRALETVPREKFVPRRYADLAWRDIALPIACGQIMPHPFALARLMEELAIEPSHRVLEIGSGSGYSAAVLARQCASVISYERYRSLVVEARARLDTLGIDNVILRFGDGLAERLADDDADGEVFDRIVIHAAVAEPPAHLMQRLAVGGRIAFGCGPVGARAPGLVVRTWSPSGFDDRYILPLRFGDAERGVSAIL